MKFHPLLAQGAPRHRATLDEIHEALTDLGLEVEGVEDRAATAEGPSRWPALQSAEQHPDADRLRVCMVETDEGLKQSSAARRMRGRASPWCWPSPATTCRRIDTTLSVGKIPRRGKPWHDGPRTRAGLSDEHSGIIELPSGDDRAEFHQLAAANDPAKVDPVIEIAINAEHDRMRSASHARARPRGAGAG